MRLPRNVKMLRGPIDAAALAGTLFLLWTVTLLHSSLVLPAGIRLNLPEAPGMLGEVLPEVAIAVDSAGRLLFQQQVVTESNLLLRLREQARTRGTNQTLLLMADRAVTMDTVTRLVTAARNAGVGEVVVATSPGPGLTVGPGARPVLP